MMSSHLSGDSREDVVDDKTEGHCGSRVQRNKSTCELVRRSSRSTSDSRDGQRRCGHVHWMQRLIDTQTLHTSRSRVLSVHVTDSLHCKQFPCKLVEYFASLMDPVTEIS